MCLSSGYHHGFRCLPTQTSPDGLEDFWATFYIRSSKLYIFVAVHVVWMPILFSYRCDCPKMDNGVGRPLQDITIETFEMNACRNLCILLYAAWHWIESKNINCN